MVLVEESVLSQVLASVPYQSPNPTNSSYLQLHECHTWTRLVRSSECLHLEPTRQLFQKKEYVTPGPDTLDRYRFLTTKKRVLNICTLLAEESILKPPTGKSLKLNQSRKKSSFDAIEPTRRSRTPLVCSAINPPSYFSDDAQMFRPMRGENLTRSPCLHRSGTHNLQTAECRYNFLQVLIC